MLYALFNDDASNPDCIALNDLMMVNDKSERM
jgi:hypothetical protein